MTAKPKAGNKKVVKKIKLQIPAGKANPAPPIGPALGGAGVNIMAFCKEFNAKTQDRQGDILPVEIDVYQDKSFSFVIKCPPVSFLIKKKAKIEKGSAIPNRNKVATITAEDALAIAKMKMADLNTASESQAVHCVRGTARSMGVIVTE